MHCIECNAIQCIYVINDYLTLNTFILLKFDFYQNFLGYFQWLMLRKLSLGRGQHAKNNPPFISQ